MNIDIVFIGDNDWKCTKVFLGKSLTDAANSLIVEANKSQKVSQVLAHNGKCKECYTVNYLHMKVNSNS